jgi:hypothetical protein
VDDLVVGAKRANQYTGWAGWLDGATGSLLIQILGGAKSETFGASLGLLGDVDGDGFAEVVVGSPSEGVPLGYAARGFSIYSGPGLEVAALAAEPLHPLSFSTALAGADVDGDGEIDLIVGSPLEDPTYLWQAGRLEVFTDLLDP